MCCLTSAPLNLWHEVDVRNLWDVLGKLFKTREKSHCGRGEDGTVAELQAIVLGVHPFVASCLRWKLALDQEKLLQEKVCSILASFLLFPWRCSLPLCRTCRPSLAVRLRSVGAHLCCPLTAGKHRRYGESSHRLRVTLSMYVNVVWA